MMHRLRHSRVVRLLGVVMEEGDYSLVIEYMAKGDLMRVLKAQVPPLPAACCPGPRVNCCAFAFLEVGPSGLPRLPWPEGGLPLPSTLPRPSALQTGGVLTGKVPRGRGVLGVAVAFVSCSQIHVA